MTLYNDIFNIDPYHTAGLTVNNLLWKYAAEKDFYNIGVFPNSCFSNFLNLQDFESFTRANMSNPLCAVPIPGYSFVNIGNSETIDDVLNSTVNNTSSDGSSSKITADENKSISDMKNTLNKLLLAHVFDDNEDLKKSIKEAINNASDGKLSASERIEMLKSAYNNAMNNADVKDAFITYIIKNGNSYNISEDELKRAGLIKSEFKIDDWNDFEKALVKYKKGEKFDSNEKILSNIIDNSNKQNILQIISFGNQNCKNKSFIEYLIDESDCQKEIVTQTMYRLINEANEIEDTIKNSDARQKIKTLKQELNDVNNPATPKEVVVERFNNLYAALRLVSAQNVESKLKEKFDGFGDSAVIGLCNEKCHSSLKNEHLGTIPKISEIKNEKKSEITFEGESSIKNTSAYKDGQEVCKLLSGYTNDREIEKIKRIIGRQNADTIVPFIVGFVRRQNMLEKGIFCNSGDLLNQIDNEYGDGWGKDDEGKKECFRHIINCMIEFGTKHNLEGTKELKGEWNPQLEPKKDISGNTEHFDELIENIIKDFYKKNGEKYKRRDRFFF